MRSTRNIWYQDERGHWVSGDYTIVEMTRQRWGLVVDGAYVSKHDSREDAAVATWDGADAEPAKWRYCVEAVAS